MKQGAIHMTTNTENLYTLKNLFGEILSKYMYEENSVEEIYINSFDKAIVQYSNGTEKEVDTLLTSEKWKLIFYYLGNLKGYRYKENEPLVAYLPNNRRFVGMMGSEIGSNIAVTIRIFNNGFNFKDFGINKHLESFLKTAILQKKNIFISGHVASGKTTFLNLLIKQIPLNERIIIIDDTPELQVPHEDKLQLLMKDYEQALHFALNSSPERLLTNELTSQNAPMIEQILNGKYQGFMTTLHAKSAKTAITESFCYNVLLNNKQDISTNKYYENIDIVLHLESNNKSNRTLTGIYFPKEDKEYFFPDNYELFIQEQLNKKD